MCFILNEFLFKFDIGTFLYFRAANSTLSPSALPEEIVMEESCIAEPTTPLDLNDTEVEKRHFLGGEAYVTQLVEH